MIAVLRFRDKEKWNAHINECKNVYARKTLEGSREKIYESGNICTNWKGAMLIDWWIIIILSEHTLLIMKWSLEYYSRACSRPWQLNGQQVTWKVKLLFLRLHRIESRIYKILTASGRALLWKTFCLGNKGFPVASTQKPKHTDINNLGRKPKFDKHTCKGPQTVSKHVEKWNK